MQTEILDQIDAFPAADWQRLNPGNDPFASPGFLGSFEKVSSGGTASPSGTTPDAAKKHPALHWQPRHLLLRDKTNSPAALLPMYLRQHSFGDFSRDWGWADAWHQNGLRYYPKLVSGIPYTPSPGPRLLVRDDLAHAEWAERMVEGAIEQVTQCGASSWQCLFVEDADREILQAAGCLMRRGVQFHWRNAGNGGYRDFDDFLAGFTSDKRKKLKRERRAVAESGLLLETLHGDAIDAATWQVIHAQYRDTFARYGNHPALPLEFFIHASARLGKRLIVFVARDEKEIVASAICYRDDTTLFGRHWGCTRQVNGLHFELCYYQGIDYCLTNGLSRFEPGAQGEHKLARGFEPTDTWSAFWIADAGMRRAVADYLRREDVAMQDYADETASHLPFRRE
jgi:predicted N-acyltransferase